MITKRQIFFFFLLSIVACASSHSRYDRCSSSAGPCVRTKWASKGKTVAGGNGPGSGFNQLNSSYGVFVDSNGNLFVSDYFNNRVVKWEKDALRGVVYAGGRCGISAQDHLCHPTALTFNKEGTLFVTVENNTNGAVIRVMPGAASGEIFITANSSLYGIVWDEKEEFLYLGHHREHRVDKYTKDGIFVSVAAGGNGNGSALNQLDYPRGVAVDENGTVYVADSNNHRLMKWEVNATEGIIFFGRGNSSGNRTDQLNLPAAIVRDKNGTIYVVDERNHRVVSVTEGDQDSTAIAGGNDQLSGPLYLAFNREGDLYVSDWDRFRVQMFAKENNPPSGYVHTLASKWTLILCFLSLIVSVVS